MKEISFCPRCGCHALEHLATHSTCIECGYSPDFDNGFSVWDQFELFAPDPLRHDHLVRGRAFRLSDRLV